MTTPHPAPYADPFIVAFLATASLGAVWSVCGQDYAPKAARVASVAASLRDLGVGQGDRVVGYLPNTPHRRLGLVKGSDLLKR
ncbi:hypothetical protein [Streptomyces sp. NBC_00120]|uniref:hypothetical protein n=1 Tax=Streptomyces sp. NBC_00120 TaxID=2975660 RepID=UPI0022528838|nr:hypothetical protein [Streptomyces sp. NBC_00120]MCX5321467.1 hypothetical protein [Streptomyces sp. NBC_00120]